MKGMDSTATPQQITMRWLARLALLFVLGIVALIADFVIWRIRLSHNIKKTLANIHAAGYPISVAELDQQYYPPIDPNQNAATLFEKAFSSLDVTNIGKNALPNLPPYQSSKKSELLSGKKLQLVTSILTTNQAALDQLRQSPAAINCRYPITLSQGYQILLPHLSSLRNAAYLLSWHAVLASKKGDSVGAVDDLNAIFRLYHSLDREPVMLSQLTRMDRVNLSTVSLEYMLNSQQFSDAQLTNLSKAFREFENPSGIERGFAMEVCNARDFFEMSGAKVYQLGRKSDTSNPDETPPPAAALNRGHQVIRMTGFFDRDFLLFLQTMQEHLKNARLPFPQRLDDEIKLQKHVADQTAHHYYLLSSVLLPGLDLLQFSEASFVAHINIAQTVLAIERYRLANQNHLPDKLSELVPAFLPAELMDPFDGKPIRYKKLAKGYMVYSIGPDRKDDGGVYAHRQKEGIPADITFVVEH